MRVQRDKSRSQLSAIPLIVASGVVANLEEDAQLRETSGRANSPWSGMSDGISNAYDSALLNVTLLELEGKSDPPLSPVKEEDNFVFVNNEDATEEERDNFVFVNNEDATEEERDAAPSPTAEEERDAAPSPTAEEERDAAFSPTGNKYQAEFDNFRFKRDMLRRERWQQRNSKRGRDNPAEEAHDGDADHVTQRPESVKTFQVQRCVSLTNAQLAAAIKRRELARFDEGYSDEVRAEQRMRDYGEVYADEESALEYLARPPTWKEAMVNRFRKAKEFFQKKPVPIVDIGAPTGAKKNVLHIPGFEA